jgi:hypothetical protein
VDYTIIHGRIVVREGRLTTIDVPNVIERHNQLAAGMLTAAP